MDENNKIKLDLSEIESVDETGMNIPLNEEPVAKEIDVASVVEEEAPAEVEAEPVTPAAEQTQQVCIIDETSTTITFEEEPDVSVNEILPSPEAAVKTAKPKVKEALKFSVLQIVIMAVVGLVALWTLFFTVDHTLAAQGRSPIFCKQTQVFEDNSTSYKGIFYKVQFKFDSNGNLTQKVCPSWKDGPNDVVASNN